MSSLDSIRKVLQNCQQEHLLKFEDQLNENEREIFLKQLSTIKFDKVNALFQKAKNSISEDVQKLDSRMQPISAQQCGSEKSASAEELLSYRKLGLEEISKGHVAVLLLAGGQGTRLGVSYPKGMYSVGLPSGKTLFQIQAERIRRVLNLAKEEHGTMGQIVWYIMTSGPTNATTKKFLEKNDYFGLSQDNVKVFQQGLLPCFDFSGKILLEEKNLVALAPDGNGGIYSALSNNHILKDMENRGIKYVHVHSVDNILVKVADPVFIGYCVTKEVECGAKVVSKDGPDEAVGVICKVDGKNQVVEYSEITNETANLRDSSGNLVFSAGNICNHFFTTEFLQKIADDYEPDLKLHVAKKKIPHVNDSGDKILPSSPNGIKIEKFIFDVFQFTERFVTWEVSRMSEFSALKNADSAKKDCPFTAKRDLLRLHKSYIEKYGGKVKDGVEVEISPLLSYSGENIEEKVKNKIFEETTILLSEEEDCLKKKIENCIKS
ncbi:UDP-N-acetylhexosamine pyrophosphorylase-like protein 1 [Anthonomus grandis grandis]|uniref:UDP-N-acetylhexosamine pyrophosphorylase-like protein 1 n=1 Tax=Anthonomus grandis grandis TaxID=2921223 RepID=UPI002165B957|nr:UDP-N-acetylhexosamine pyrophosphorylase-like protein 1 [Anthonomus grandis grandis]